MENLVILQEIKRQVTGAGWTRRLFLAYTVNEGPRYPSPVVLTEDEGRYLLRHFFQGGSVTLEGKVYLQAVSLDELCVEAREMKEYRRLEAAQKGISDAAPLAKLAPFYHLKRVARNIFLERPQEIEGRVAYASEA